MKSWVEGADESLFSLDNLPYGVFNDSLQTAYRVGVAIGDFVLDLALLEQQGFLKHTVSHPLFQCDTLNDFAAQGPQVWQSIRQQLQTLLSDHHTAIRESSMLDRVLLPRAQITMKMPFHTEAFTDFYASEHHASNVGKLFRGPENPLLPNWKYLPVGYHGRASTLFISGTSIRRPHGQIKLPDQDSPQYSPSKKLDFELEMGFFIGVGNPNGEPITVNHASQSIFGMVLLNDWSARDIQAFEYQPLGPFLSKSFATSISPWVVPMAALQDFMQPLPTQTPTPVAYLQQTQRTLPAIKLHVELQPHGQTEKITLCETTLTELYWSLEQMVAHHTVNRCILKTGDLLGTGTISGPQPNSWGSLLELTFNGKEPLKLADGQTRTFLADGDTLIMHGYCDNGHKKIGLGCVVGQIDRA